VVELADTYV